jgi:hypothetical protein
MTDPVYLKLREDAGVVLMDLWRAIWPVKANARKTAVRPAKPAAHQPTKSRWPGW